MEWAVGCIDLSRARLHDPYTAMDPLGVRSWAVPTVGIASDHTQYYEPHRTSRSKVGVPEGFRRHGLDDRATVVD